MNPEIPDTDNMPILTGVFESLQQGVAIFSADRKLVYLNGAMARVTGGGASSIGGALEKLSQRHRLRTKDGHPIDPKDFPVARAFAGEETHGQPYLYVAEDDRHIWLSVSCIRVLDDSGSLTYVVAVIADISDNKSKEDKLRFMVESAKVLNIAADFHTRLSEKARLAVPLLADWCAIDILSPSGTSTERVVVVHRDPKMIDYIFEFQKKYPPDQTAPTSVYNSIINQKEQFVPSITEDMLVSSAQSPEHLEAIKKLRLKSVMVVPIIARGKGLGALTLAYAESGRVYTAADLQFFKEFCAHLGVVLDNARLYEEIKQRDEAKDLFLASLSHELRNPLAPIKSALETLRMRELDPAIREDVDVIEHQFDHMARLLGDLLDVTRFTQAKINVSPHRVDLRKLVERALKAADALLKNADVMLHFTYPSMSLEVMADETRMEQAISNLMSNAIKFTPAGGSIWVEVEKVGAEVRISVRDNGAGIHAEDLPNIFNMYYQGAYTRDHASSGLGIGLLLVKRIVDLHGGTIVAESAGLGKGSTFTIHLPLVLETSDEYGGQVQPPASARGKRVLIVDDNAAAADSLAKLLNRVGANADALYSGEEMLGRDLSSYDVLLVDVGMPRMDGYEAVKELRKRGVAVPVIALTGYGMADDKQRAKEAGFTAHLTKPIGLQDLSETIASLT